MFFVMCIDASPGGGVCRKETEMAQIAENKVAGDKRVDFVLPFFCCVIKSYRTVNFKSDRETGGR